jgi:FKBP-type peptidyl-prolyl cis-trans isomerase 2
MAMRTAQMGDCVRVHYFCRRLDGTPVESTLRGPPAEIAIGEGLLLEPVEQALVGMAPGDRKTVRLTPDEAFGPYREDLLCEVPRAKLSEVVEPQPGMLVQVIAPGKGCPAQGVIVDLVGDHAVVIDGNHQLAGETLVYELQCIDFVD